jgi:hypothetical protein
MFEKSNFRTILVILFPVFLLTLASKKSFAVDYTANSSEMIRGSSAESGLRFEATYLSDNTVYIFLELKDKEVEVYLSDLEGGMIHIRAYKKASRKTSTLSADDSERIKSLLTSTLKDDMADRHLGKMFRRTLNFLYSWPPVLPLQVSMTDFMGSKSGPGQSPVQDSDNVMSACDIPVPKGLSDDLCGEMNVDHDGDYINLAYAYEWIIWPILGKFIPLRCSDFQRIVGPYPFEQGDCFGRCGKGCIGDGPPNRDVNIFTQNCFNHDACVGQLGYLHPYCNQMIIYAIVDTFFGPECVP